MIKSKYGLTFTQHNNKAFTLAEVLIALVVIGIIAAITMTTVMPNIQERINSERQANIVYKITQATNLMKANGALGQFDSTDAFVDELQKYLKIMKRCDYNHIADCWPTKKVRTSDEKEFEVKEAVNRGKLGMAKNRDVKNVGIVLNDGASLIMTYDPTNQGVSIGDHLIAFPTQLPAGGKYEQFLDYTTNTTGGLAFVMDVNGGRGPNSETIGNRKYDIRSFNGAHFLGCPGTKYDNKCYYNLDSWSYVNCTLEENAEYCNGHKTSTSTNYYVGAIKACDDLGLKMPSSSELGNIFNNSDLMESLGIQTDKQYAYYHECSNCYVVNRRPGGGSIQGWGWAEYDPPKWKIVCVSG